MKIGIANDKTKDTKDYVLGKFSKKELELINNNMDLYKEIIIDYINYGIENAMMHYNKK